MDATKCGAFIAKLRNEREMTQKDLSEVLNVSTKQFLVGKQEKAILMYRH